MRAGRFREDLFFRLNVVALRLSALRDHLEDLPALVDIILARLCARHGRGLLTLDAATRTALAEYRWPGNVRELVNALERAVVLARGATIGTEDLPDRLVAPAPDGPPPPTGSSLEDLEQRHVRQVLAESSTLEEAAARLGINVTTLWRKRKRWGLD